jgi:hypothetical protein
MALDKQTCRKLCNWVIDDLFYTNYHQSDGAVVYIDILQDRDSVKDGTVLKSYIISRWHISRWR